MGPELASSSKLQLNSSTRRAPTRSQPTSRKSHLNSLTAFPGTIKQRWRKEEAIRREIRERKRERKAEKDSQRREAGTVASDSDESISLGDSLEDEDEDDIRSYYASPARQDSDDLDPRTKKRRRIWRDPLSVDIATGPSYSRSISPSVLDAALQAKAEQNSESLETDDGRPSTELLKFIHSFASEYYTSRGWLSLQPIPKAKSRKNLKGTSKMDSKELDSGRQDRDGDREVASSKNARKSKQTNLDMYRLFDGSGLMAIGMLLQEYVVGAIAGESEPPEAWLREMGYIEDEDRSRANRHKRKKDQEVALTPSFAENRLISQLSRTAAGDDSEDENSEEDDEECGDSEKDETGADDDNVQEDNAEEEEQVPEEAQGTHSGDESKDREGVSEAREEQENEEEEEYDDAEGEYDDAEGDQERRRA